MSRILAHNLANTADHIGTPVQSGVRGAVHSTRRLTSEAHTRLRLHGDGRLPADLLDPRTLLHLAQQEHDLTLAELRPLHGLFPYGSMET